MDSQSYQYWFAQSNYLSPNTHQNPVYELPPDLSKVPSLSGSPVSSTYDQFPQAMPQDYYPRIASDSVNYSTYPITPSEFNSDHETPYCSPRPPHNVEPVFAQPQTAAPVEQTHATSGRRRAQNRAAQRAFRERKEKHARDLEAQLSALTERYAKLETSHTELNAAYDKLRRTFELLTADDDSDAPGDADDADDSSRGAKAARRRSSSGDTLRKLLDIMHGELKTVAVKAEPA